MSTINIILISGMYFILVAILILVITKNKPKKFKDNVNINFSNMKCIFREMDRYTYEFTINTTDYIDIIELQKIIVESYTKRYKHE